MFEILPYAFKRQYQHKEYDIKYDSIVELGQGGPEVGRLQINGENYFQGKYFSGPLLIAEELIYLPVLYRSWLSSGFKLGVINLNNFSLELFGKKENLILIQNIDSDYLYYYTDIGNQNRKRIHV